MSVREGCAVLGSEPATANGFDRYGADHLECRTHDTHQVPLDSKTGSAKSLDLNGFQFTTSKSPDEMHSGMAEGEVGAPCTCSLEIVA